MRDLDRKNDKMNASLEFAAKEAAKQPVVYPDNCIVRNGVVVGTDQRGSELRRVSPGHSK